jgi:hypothetical protein
MVLLGAGEGNRTLVISLEGFCSTIELHPRRSRRLAGAAGPQTLVAERYIALIPFRNRSASRPSSSLPHRLLSPTTKRADQPCEAQGNFLRRKWL